MKKIVPLLAGFSLLLSACSTGQGSSETIKIGVIAPMTGDAAVYGEEMKHALDYQLAVVNGNSQGYQFELIYEDGQCGAGATSAFQKLTDVDGVSFVIGGACSSETLAFAPLLEGKNVVAVSPLSSSPELDGLSPNLLSLSYSDAGVGEEIADQLKDFTKIAILSEQNDYNIAMYDTVMASLEGSGVEVVSDETVEKGATDFRNALQKIKSAEPEVVFFNVNVGVTTETMLKQLLEIENWNVVRISSGAVMFGDYISLNPEVMEGFIVVDTPKTNSPEFLAVQETITTTQGSVENIGAYYTASTLDALTVLTTAIMNADADPVRTLAEIRSGSFKGYIGTIVFGDETFVQGIGTATYVVKNGVWTQQ